MKRQVVIKIITEVDAIINDLVTLRLAFDHNRGRGEKRTFWVKADCLSKVLQTAFLRFGNSSTIPSGGEVLYFTLL